MSPAIFARRLFATGLLLAGLTAAAEPIDTADVLSSPNEEVERRLPDSHPAMYLVYAGRLWYEARSDDAVFWLYVGQIRYRLYLAAHPRMDPSTDPARFKRLLEVTGEPIERYAGGDIPKWRSQLAQALLWDKENPNNYTSTSRYDDEWHDARATLTNLITYLFKNAATLRRLREQDGIGETGMRTPDGPYVEVQRRKMPRDWPELLPHTTPPMLNGFYDASAEAGLGPILFPDDPPSVAAATSFELAADDDDRHVRVTARNDRQIIAETVLAIEETPVAIIFTKVRKDADAGLKDGRRTTRCIIRRSEVGDLIIQRDTLTTGTYPGKNFDVRLESTNWHRVPRLAPEDEPR